MMRPVKRSTRVAHVVQQELSRIVQEMVDMEQGLVTITRVRMSDDLLDAWVDYSVIGDDDHIERYAEFFKEQGVEIRHRLSQRVQLRKVPRLTFEYDSTPAHADKIFSILEKIKKEK